jgi:formylmethanofuran dehydrogenase subunit E
MRRFEYCDDCGERVPASEIVHMDKPFNDSRLCEYCADNQNERGSR